MNTFKERFNTVRIGEYSTLQKYLATRARYPKRPARDVLAAIRGDFVCGCEGKAIKVRDWPPASSYNPRFDSGLRSFKHVRWIERAETVLRLVGFADEIDGSRVNHQGWFTDEFQGEVLRGVVYRLPHGRFAYGYADPNGNGGAALLCFDNDAESIEDAARYADQFAERMAEREREYQDKWHAARRIEDARERIKAAREEYSALAGEIRAVTSVYGPLAPHACMALRKQLRMLADNVHNAVREIRETLDTYGDEILKLEFN